MIFVIVQQSSNFLYADVAVAFAVYDCTLRQLILLKKAFLNSIYNKVLLRTVECSLRLLLNEQKK